MKQIQIVASALTLALMLAPSAGVEAADTRSSLSQARPSKTSMVAPRIVGGTLAVGDRSFAVRVINDFSCGGTIIADSWVLTAAHCGVTREIYAGSNDKASQTKYTVAQYIKHPSYGSNGDAYDYALVRINGSFPASHIRAKLADATVMQAVAKPGDPVTVLGWGDTSENGSGSNSLREVTVPVVSDATCAASYNGSSAAQGLKLTPAVEICAGVPQGGKDSCQGDSGGPLIAPYNGSIYSIGVVSYGLGCARPNYYGVYAETAAMLNWINSNIGGSTTPPPSGTQTYTNGTDYQIRDNSTVTSSIAVSGRTGFGSATTPVAVDIRHTYIGDLKVDLIAPDGSVYVLHSRVGGTTDNITRTFTVNLSSEALNGTWKLRVNDNATYDTGYINSWSVTF